MKHYTDLVPVPDEATFNLGLTSPRNSDMLKYLGHPVKGGKYLESGKCTTVDNLKFKSLLTTASVGPFRTTGIWPAIESMRSVFDRVKNEVPDLYAILGTAGMQCARFTKIRQKDGSIKIGPNISNHTWGTAIDIRLDGKLDAQGNDKVQRGLLILSTYFNTAGWYWGAAFPTEDAMHFEVSKSLLARWKRDGLLEEVEVKFT